MLSCPLVHHLVPRPNSQLASSVSGIASCPYGPLYRTLESGTTGNIPALLVAVDPTSGFIVELTISLNLLKSKRPRSRCSAGNRGLSLTKFVSSSLTRLASSILNCLAMNCLANQGTYCLFGVGSICSSASIACSAVNFSWVAAGVIAELNFCKVIALSYSKSSSVIRINYLLC